MSKTLSIPLPGTQAKTSHASHVVDSTDVTEDLARVFSALEYASKVVVICGMRTLLACTRDKVTDTVY
jgi:hypothetical protein